MKKMIYFVIIYTVLALVTGVFFREFTKAYNFDGVTTLGKMHVHLFALGMLFFLLVGILCDLYHINNNRVFKPFIIIYNIGLPLAVIMMLIRGIMQVAKSGGIDSTANSVISYLAGLGHIILAVGLILFLVSLAISVSDKAKQKMAMKRAKI